MSNYKVEFPDQSSCCLCSYHFDYANTNQPGVWVEPSDDKCTFCQAVEEAGREATDEQQRRILIKSKLGKLVKREVTK